MGAAADFAFIAEFLSQTSFHQPLLYSYLGFTFRDSCADICQCYFSSQLQTVMKI